jgi:hypothetical protein
MFDDDDKWVVPEIKITKIPAGEYYIKYFDKDAAFAYESDGMEEPPVHWGIDTKPNL